MSYDPYSPPVPPDETHTPHGGTPSDGSFQSLGGYSSDNNPLLPTYNQYTDTADSYSNPLLPRYGQPSAPDSYSNPPTAYNQPADTADSYSNPLLPRYGQPSAPDGYSNPPTAYHQPADTADSYSNPLLPRYGQPSAPDGYSNPPTAYHQPADTTDSYSNPLLPRYGQPSAPDSYSNPPTAYPSSSPAAAPFPPAAPASPMTAEDYVPDDEAVKKKRKEYIRSLIITAAVIVIGGILLHLFLGTIDDPSGEGSAIIWRGFFILAAVFLVFSAVHLIAFLTDPTHKRFYKAEAQQAVRRSRFEHSRRQYEAIHPPAAATADRPSSQTSRRRNDKPISFKGARTIFLIGVLVVIGFSLPIIVPLIAYLQEEDFIRNAVVIDAEVTNYRSERRHSSSKTGSRFYTVHYITVDYVYGDTLYRRGEYRVDQKMSHGSHVTLYIDPHNPGDCRQKPNRGSLIWGSVGFVPPLMLGIFFLVSGIVYMIKAKKRERDGTY